MSRPSFFWTVFGGTVVVVLVTALVVYFASLSTLEGHLSGETESRVASEARIVARLAGNAVDAAAQPADFSDVNGIAEDLGEARVTLIAASGEVLFDSHQAPATMDDHAGRPEVMAPGTAVTRFSNTLQQEMTYFALPVERRGEVVLFARVALAVQDRDARAADLRVAIRNAAVLASVIALIFAGFFARWTTRPLSVIAEVIAEVGRGGPIRRVPVSGSDEISRLAAAVNTMGDDLQEQIARIERDRAEREAILSAMGDGLLAVDLENRVLFVNRPARRLLQLADRSVKRQSVGELTSSREVEGVLEECRTEAKPAHGEAHFETSDGDRRVELSAVPLAGEAGGRRGSVLVLRDVTELRRLEEVRRDFVSNVSHELKTPLTAMRGYVEAVLDDAAMDQDLRRSFLSKAQGNTERLSAIVSDLLSLSRLESEERELAFEEVVLDEFVNEVAGEWRELAESRGVTLELEVPERARLFYADYQAMGMALSNLISNAIQHSEQGGRVVVRFSRSDTEVCIEVIDEGVGIPEEEQERIFERFYRVDKARSRRLGGTGLGLSIVRHVMAAHGGRVELASRVGEGSTFRLVLPG